MSVVLGISGSLRKGSYNTALLRVAASVAPAGTTVELASIRDIPLYDGDVDAAGQPAPVLALKDRVAACDGLLLASPEYNHSVPGTLKNTIDWLSRPPKDIDRVFGNKPVAVIGASGGRGATHLAQAAWLPIFHVLGMRVWSGGSVAIAEASKVFDAEGKIADEKTMERVARFMAGFAAFVGAR